MQTNRDLLHTRLALTSYINILPYGIHPFSPRAQTISILSDPLYSPAPFPLRLLYTLFISNFIHSCHSHAFIFNPLALHTLLYFFSYSLIFASHLVFLFLIYFYPNYSLAPVLRTAPVHAFNFTFSVPVNNEWNFMSNILAK